MDTQHTERHEHGALSKACNHLYYLITSTDSVMGLALLGGILMLWAPLPTDSLATASLVLLTGTKPILHEEAFGPEVAPGSLWIQVQRGL